MNSPDNFHNNLMKERPLLSVIYREECRGSETLWSLPKVIELVTWKVGL